MRRQLATRDVGERHLLEHEADVCAERDPDLAQLLGRARIFELLGRLPADVRERPLDCSDHVRDRDLVRGSRQGVPARLTAAALDDSGTAEVAQDVLEEVDRNVLRFRDLLCIDEPADGGELDRGTNGVVRLGGGAHARIMLGAMVTGGCLCGGVRFEISEPLGAFTYCHCTRCQRRTGGAWSAQVRLAPSSVRFLEGEELVKGWQPPDDGWEKCFCATCGSQLFSKKQDGTLWSVRMGALDEDPGVSPKHRQFVAYAATWEPIPDDGIPHYDEGAPPS
jgi:hypothetical protein